MEGWGGAEGKRERERERERESVRDGGDRQTGRDHKENPDTQSKDVQKHCYLCVSARWLACEHQLSSLDRPARGTVRSRHKSLVRVLFPPSPPRPFLFAISKSGFHYNLST